MRVNTIPEYKVIADDGHAFRPQIVYVDPESETENYKSKVRLHKIVK